MFFGIKIGKLLGNFSLEDCPRNFPFQPLLEARKAMSLAIIQLVKKDQKNRDFAWPKRLFFYAETCNIFFPECFPKLGKFACPTKRTTKRTKSPRKPSS